MAVIGIYIKDKNAVIDVADAFRKKNCVNEELFLHKRINFKVIITDIYSCITYR